MALNLVRASSQRVESADAASLNIGTGAATMMAWYKPLGTFAVFGGIISKRTSGETGYNININSADKVELRFASGAPEDTVSSATLLNSSTTWYHVCGVRDGTNVIVYINGVSDGSVVDNLRNTDAAVVLSSGPYRSGDTTQHFLDGKVCGVKVWKGRALTAAEIGIEKACLEVIQYRSQAVLSFPYDNGAVPAKFYDETINNNDGTPVNTPTMNNDFPANVLRCHPLRLNKLRPKILAPGIAR